MFRTFRLTNEPDGLGLSCTHAGLALAGTPLLHKTTAGFVPRPANEIASLVGAAYGGDPTRLQSSIWLIAEALNGGNFARAAIAAVLTGTPELSREAAERLAKAEAKLTKYDEDESRDWHGRWTDEDAEPPNAQGAVGDGIGANEDAFLQPVAFTELAGGADSDDAQNPKSIEEAFERKYDDLGPVEFAKEVIQFGDWLGRNGQDLAPDDKEQVLAEYSFIQDRLNFWQAYDYTPPLAQLNLHSASLTLYQGAVNGGLVGPGDLPRSMLDVAGAVAVGTDSAPPNLRPAAAKPNFELPRAAEDEVYPEIKGYGGVMDNSELGIVWGKGNREQSEKWENKYGELNPDARRLVKGTTGFDYSEDNIGEAIDAKTLDTLTVSRIKRPQQLLSRLKLIVNERGENYEPKRETDLEPDDIKSKTIQLAVPEYASPTQWLYLNLGIRYARDHGISLVITRIRE